MESVERLHAIMRRVIDVRIQIFSSFGILPSPVMRHFCPHLGRSLRPTLVVVAKEGMESRVQLCTGTEFDFMTWGVRVSTRHTAVAWLA